MPSPVRQPNNVMRYHRSSRAFTLIEIMVAVFIGMVLLSVFLSYAPAALLQRAINREDEELNRLAAAFTLSLERDDLATENLSAVVGQVPAGVTPTAFSTSLVTPTTTATNDWFAKLGKVQGITVLPGTAPTRAQQPELARIVLNDRNRPRYLFVGPTAGEPNQQRFIICSVLADDALTLPPYSAASEFFEALWNHNFDTGAQGLPSYWTANLPADTQIAWSDGASDASNLSRLRIKRIVVPKFVVSVNNNHATISCWVYWNGNPGVQFAANTGAAVTNPIISGRQIRVTVGMTEATAVEKYRLNIRKNVSVTVE